MVQRPAALRIVVIHSLVQYCYALHFNLLLLPFNLLPMPTIFAMVIGH